MNRAEAEREALKQDLKDMGVKARQYKQGKAEVEIQRMRRELSGCDWCCGGGDKRLAHLYRVIDLVNEIHTESHNAAMATGE